MCYNTSCSAKEEMLFLREKIRLGKFSVNTRQSYCRCQHWPRQKKNTFLRRIYGDCNWRYQTACDKMVASPPEEKGPRKHIITNKCATNALHVHRHYLCLASISLSMPLRLWGEGDLHWKCDGNQAVATLSVTVSDSAYCKAPVHSHTQIVGPAWYTQLVNCSIYCQTYWQRIKKKMMERKSDFCERCHFASFSSSMPSLNDHGNRCLHAYSFSRHLSLMATFTWSISAGCENLWYCIYIPPQKQP